MLIPAIAQIDFEAMMYKSPGTGDYVLVFTISINIKYFWIN